MVAQWDPILPEASIAAPGAASPEGSHMAVDSKLISVSVLREPAEDQDDIADIRYSLTALGEAVVSDRRGPRFRGFGPCSAASGAAESVARH